ncbi:type I-B CRISPR-associated endonuclease Cas1b [Oceanithermus sp.]|uniref:type I-B CRISPR-associated endonuclease Cas1b n=1 Tax=Oceanithermus sp. TaxID=2268145 RepID=UPI00257AEC13|nr:type I-B CRISPR-associated endonuclease Cas1b [Oceanithermus sp.]
MKRTLYVFQSGRLRRRHNTVCLEREGEDGVERRVLPIEQLREIHLFGEVTLNSRLLRFLARREVLIHVHDRHGWYTGTFYPREHYNSGHMVLRQAEHCLDPTRRLDLARRFVGGALANLAAVLRYYAGRGHGVSLAPILEGLERHQARLPEAGSVEELMQIEGQAREIFYPAFDAILGRAEFAFQQRTRRPPRNRLNALISFVNSLLYAAVLAEIYKTHLDPRIGYLHATNFRRFTLNLDVAEVFRPVLADRLVLRLVRLGRIRPSDFEEALGGMYLTAEGRRRVVEAWEQRLATTLYHRGLRRHVSYRTLIRLELYRLQKHLLGEKPYEPFRSRW